MKVIRKFIKTTTIEKFADKHGLVMEVHERELPENHPHRYYAHFQYAELAEGGMLIGNFGDGATPELAIKDYAKQITLKTLCVNAHDYPDKERRISVPRFKGVK